jgi:hypothetical protein
MDCLNVCKCFAASFERLIILGRILGVFRNAWPHPRRVWKCLAAHNHYLNDRVESVNWELTNVKIFDFLLF